MLTRFFKRRRPEVSFPDLAPEQPLIVIGDVHGRADLLQKVPEPEPNAQAICVGDYIDRGENSAGVLRLLHTSPQVVCLMGNHEEMLLRFLDNPAKYGPRWLRYGGLQTLASFDISQVAETTGPDQLTGVRDALKAAMGPDLINWMRGLPSVWQSGNVVVTHAGADPSVPIRDQDPRSLRWGHPEFETIPRRDGLWVVHGHTIVDAPVMENGRINVDTGAYATGRLTTALITDQGVEFETIT